ncbi:MAG: hypothetical protein IKJ89_07315 [Kiritimatiellae bacterium]|nr:hypothetical protein [Kiritimatiellia bacterium]
MDELIYRMEELANKKAFPQLLKAIVLLVDENLRLKVMLKQPLPEKCGCTCEHPDLILDGGHAAQDSHTPWHRRIAADHARKMQALRQDLRADGSHVRAGEAPDDVQRTREACP